MGKFSGEPTTEPVEAVKQQPEPQPQPQAEPVQEQPQPRTIEEVIASTQLPDVAKDWLRKHPEFVTDRAKSELANKYHETAKYLAGGEEFTPRYLEKLEEVLEMRQPSQQDIAPPRTNGSIPPPPPRQAAPQPQPQRPQQYQQPVQQYRGAPPSAPPSNRAPSMSTGRPIAQMPPLNSNEREIAIASKHSGMSDEQAVRRYQELKAQLTRDGQMGERWRGS